MNLTSKSRYGLKILMDLTYHAGQDHVHRRDIALRQGVPLDYLDQIMIKLRRANLITSVRGRGGGYRLGRAPADISVWDIFAAVEEMIEPVQCMHGDDGCGFDVACISKSAWQTIYMSMREPLMALNLETLTRGHVDKHQLCPAAGVRECRAPHIAAMRNVLREVRPS